MGMYFKGFLAAPPSCQGCPLAGQRIVPPVGNLDAEIAFVGEGAGGDEVRAGEPFVGAVGQYLMQILGALGLSREDVWLDNATGCRPKSATYGRPGFEVMLLPDDAKRVAARHCRYRLWSGLHALRTRGRLKVVVPLGRIAYESVHGVDRSILARRGSIEPVDFDKRLREAWQEVTSLYR